jgi:hypothetical protein
VNDEHALKESLLIAAFAGKKDARAAWHRWEHGSGWQSHVDFDSYLLLPRIYHNLGGDSVEDELFGRLKGVIRQNWVTNTSSLRMVKSLIDSSRLPAEFLWVLPPLSLLSQDRSTALSDRAPAVWLPRKSDLPSFAADMRTAGWRMSAKRIPDWCMSGFLAAASSLDWEHSRHGVLQVRWHCGYSDTPIAWHPQNNATEASLADQQVYCLCASDTVRYLILAPGMGSAFERCSRAILYLWHNDNREGWQCLMQLLQAESSPYLGTVRRLAPKEIGSELQAQPDMAPEFPAQGVSARLPFFRKQYEHWHSFHKDLGSDTGIIQSLIAMPGYLMGKWNLAHPAEIPRRLAQGILSDYRHRSKE